MTPIEYIDTAKAQLANAIDDLATLDAEFYEEEIAELQYLSRKLGGVQCAIFDNKPE